MATQGERRALIFLAAVALLGAGTRAWRARHLDVDSADLAAQIEAVDSAKPSRPARRKPPAAGRQPRSRQSRDTLAGASAQPARPIPAPPAPVDVDRASADEIERLPGIGPALARRIVADRDANGSFGCLAALDGVKGIGPALLARLDSLATFSGAGRPACAKAGAGAATR
jgi:competence protein ComEA